jgi:hypothetical protein
MLFVYICRDRGCIAVLSNDSDFLIYDAPGFAPFWGLDIGTNNVALAHVFTRAKLAKALNIR